MNTGEKNTKGRTIYKGPRGGRYVLGPGGSKVRSFTAAPPVPVVAAPSTPNVPGFSKTSYINVNNPNTKVYKKNASGRYYLMVKNANGTLKPTRTITKSKYMVKNTRTGAIKTINGHVGLVKKKNTVEVVIPPTIVEGKMPTPSPRPVISMVERNRRLAEIRRRLNALRIKYRAEKPKARKNIEEKLRLAVLRTRARRNERRNSLRGWSTRHVRIPFCHAPASVPRKPCTEQTIKLPVYGDGNPLIESGSVVAMQEKDFDLEWFRRQNNYVSKLSDYDFWTVQAHTNRSHTWIGPYTYKGNLPSFRGLGGAAHITPLWPQLRKMILNGTYRTEVAWVKTFKNATTEKERYDLLTRNLSKVPAPVKKAALELYKKDLKRIIAGAPRAKKKMILYRGSSFDIFNGNPGHWYKLKSFCSAAYNLNHAMIYGSMFTRITILPGSPVLLVAGTNQWGSAGEYEVMVNIDTQYLIRVRGVTRHAYYNGQRSYTRTGYRVTDVTIAK